MAYIIAEIGVNHEGSLERAVDLIKDAALAGCNAVKFQTYKAETLAAKTAKSYWDTTQEKETNQRSLFKKYETCDIGFYTKLKEICFDNKIDFMTTFFSVELVRTMGHLVSKHKISSSDLTNYMLIEEIVSQGKPIIASVGASSIEEIKNFKSFIFKLDPKIDLTIMHCVLNYPTKFSNANLAVITNLKNQFSDLKIGYSCHVAGEDGIHACRIANILGAKTIEKHFTQCTLRDGNDHYHALNAEGFKRMSDLIVIDNKFLGNGLPNLSKQKDARLFARRGIYWAKDIKIGEIITKDHLIALRPSEGTLSADRYELIVGKKVAKNFKKDDPINLEFIL